jgi:hypothetical protein
VSQYGMPTARMTRSSPISDDVSAHPMADASFPVISSAS